MIPAEGGRRQLGNAKRDDEALRVTETLLTVLPKVELHTHLAGNVPEWLFLEAAGKYGLELADPEHP